MNSYFISNFFLGGRGRRENLAVETKTNNLKQNNSKEHGRDQLVLASKHYTETAALLTIGGVIEQNLYP